MLLRETTYRKLHCYYKCTGKLSKMGATLPEKSLFPDSRESKFLRLRVSSLCTSVRREANIFHLFSLEVYLYALGTFLLHLHFNDPSIRKNGGKDI